MQKFHIVLTACYLPSRISRVSKIRIENIRFASLFKQSIYNIPSTIMTQQVLITNYFNINKQSSPPSSPKANESNNKIREYEKKDVIKDEDYELLKEFDLNWRFGPCCGLSRLDRWERASKLSLNPPQKVKEVILKNINNLNYTMCIWDQNALLQPMACGS